MINGIGGTRQHTSFHQKPILYVTINLLMYCLSVFAMSQASHWVFLGLPTSVQGLVTSQIFPGK